MIGIVRSPLPTTLLQVFSRLLLVWGIVDTYPDATSHSPFYSSMLIAWSISEIVRYSYFVFNLRRGRSISIGGGSGAGGLSSNSGRGSPKEVVEDVPALLTWARYNFFYVLYPLGIGSEMALIWKASEEVAGAQSSLSSSSIWWRWVLWGVLGGYIPGEFGFIYLVVFGCFGCCCFLVPFLGFLVSFFFVFFGVWFCASSSSFLPLPPLTSNYVIKSPRRQSQQASKEDDDDAYLY